MQTKKITFKVAEGHLGASSVGDRLGAAILPRAVRYFQTCILESTPVSVKQYPFYDFQTKNLYLILDQNGSTITPFGAVQYLYTLYSGVLRSIEKRVQTIP